MKEIYDYDFSLIGSTIKKIQNILILALVYKFIFVILLRFYLRSNTMKLILYKIMYRKDSLYKLKPNRVIK